MNDNTFFIFPFFKGVFILSSVYSEIVVLSE